VGGWGEIEIKVKLSPAKAAAWQQCDKCEDDLKEATVEEVEEEGHAESLKELQIV
jgi:hypothetical protein